MGSSGALNLLYPQGAAQAAAIQNKQALALELIKKSQQPIQVAQGTKISPFQGLAQMLDAYQGQSELNDSYDQLSNLYTNQAAATGSGLTGQPTPVPQGASSSPSLIQRLGNYLSDDGDSAPASPSAGQAPSSAQQLGTSLSNNPTSSPAPQDQGLAPPGMSPHDALVAASLFPEAFGTAAMDRFKPTDQMKNDVYRGITPDMSKQMALSEAAKNMGITGGLPSFDQSGNMSVAPVPGAQQVNANMTGANKAAEQANTIFPNQTVNGREGVPVTGAQIQQQFQPADQLKQLTNQAAQKNGVDPNLVHAVMMTESSGNPTAVSSKGAMGLMQLTPATARDLGVNPADPAQNVQGGAAYLKQLTDKYGGDQTKATMAYNWGQGNVDKWLSSGANPAQVPQETKDYISKVQLNKISAAAQDSNGSSQPLQFGQTPTQKSYTTGAGTNMADFEKDLNSKVEAGSEVVQRINRQQELLNNFRTGATGDARERLAAYARDMGASEKVVKGLGGGDPAAAQEFEKLAVQTNLQQLRETIGNNRMLKTEFDAFSQANPSIGTDPAATTKAFDWMRGVYKRDFTQQQALAEYKKSGQPIDQFPAAYAAQRNANIPVNAPAPQQTQLAQGSGNSPQSPQVQPVTKTLGGKNYTQIKGQWYVQ